LLVSVVDPGADLAAVEEMHLRFRTPPPPPPLKGRKVGGGGVRNCLSRAVDPGALILTVEEVRPGFRTPPPPPLRLKVERRGGSGIPSVPLIWARDPCRPDLFSFNHGRI
jgi:hypothetical protein